MSVTRLILVATEREGLRWSRVTTSQVWGNINWKRAIFIASCISLLPMNSVHAHAESNDPARGRSGSLGGFGYQERMTLEFRGGGVLPDDGIPLCATNFIRYRSSPSDTVEFVHDIMNDSLHFWVAVPAEFDAAMSWSAAGGGSILKDGSIYYIALRQRSAEYAGGKEWQIWESTNLSFWTKTWELDRDSVSNRSDTVLSMEAMTLRRVNGTYYLHFCVRDYHAMSWAIHWVKAGSITALKDSLKDGNAWHYLTNGVDTLRNGHKDPRVFKWNGKWYILWNDDGVPRRVCLAEDTTITFNSFTCIDTLSEVYADSFVHHSELGSPSYIDSSAGYLGPGSPGMIFYDIETSKFIFWGTAWHQGSGARPVYWYFCVADSLRGPWSFVCREKVVEDYRSTVTKRHFDYHVLDEDRLVMIMEWDHDGDSRGDLFVWDYIHDFVVGCAVWAEPDVAEIEETISLHMKVQNRSSEYVDSVVPHVRLVGSGNVILNDGPIPPYAHIPPGSDTVFSWAYSAQDTGRVHWLGWVCRRDADTYQELVSREEMSNTVFVTLPKICGDCNGDRSITIADAIFLIGYIYRGGSVPSGEGDVNSDGRITVADATHIVAYVYRGGPAPCEPLARFIH